MKAFKIRVQSPEHSKKIQEHLFSLGYGWRMNPRIRIIRFTDAAFILAFEDKQLYRSNNELYFNEHRLPEVELVEKISYEFKEIPKREVVKIGEKFYFLDELEIALKNINPI